MRVERETAVYQQEIARVKPELPLETVEINNKGRVNTAMTKRGYFECWL